MFAMTNYAKKYASTIWISFLCNSFECSRIACVASAVLLCAGSLVILCPFFDAKAPSLAHQGRNALYHLSVNGSNWGHQFYVP